jgi:hypothetical protein
VLRVVPLYVCSGHPLSSPLQNTCDVPSHLDGKVANFHPPLHIAFAEDKGVSVLTIGIGGLVCPNRGPDCSRPINTIPTTLHELTQDLLPGCGASNLPPAQGLNKVSGKIYSPISLFRIRQRIAAFSLPRRCFRHFWAADEKAVLTMSKVTYSM